MNLHQWGPFYVKRKDALPITSVSLQIAMIVWHQWLQLWQCPSPTKYHHFQSEHHSQPEHNFSPSGQAWSCSGSNMHWRSSHKSGCCDNSIHHSKSAIVSLEYQTFTQPPFWRSPNLIKISLKRRILNTAIGTNWSQPAKVAIVADYIQTSILFNSVLCSVIPPKNILVPTCSNVVNNGIVLNNLLAVSWTKSWTVDSWNPAIEMGNALKCKTGIPTLTLCAIVMASWSWWPLDMSHIHWSAIARQTSFLVVFSNPVQLHDVHWQRNVLLPHLVHCMKKRGKEFANFWNRYVTQHLAGAKWCSYPQAVESGHDK